VTQQQAKCSGDLDVQQPTTNCSTCAHFNEKKQLSPHSATIPQRGIYTFFWFN